MSNFLQKYNEWKQDKYSPEKWKAALMEAKEEADYIRGIFKHPKHYHFAGPRRRGTELLMFQRKYLAEQEKKNV